MKISLLAVGLILLSTGVILDRQSKREDLLIDNRALKRQVEDLELQVKILRAENANLKYKNLLK